jgi:hypothetical protein
MGDDSTSSWYLSVQLLRIREIQCVFVEGAGRFHSIREGATIKIKAPMSEACHKERNQACNPEIVVIRSCNFQIS